MKVEIPLEIWEMILAEFKDDRASLAKFSLVNQVWLRVCWRLLFWRLNLKGPKSFTRWITVSQSARRYRRRWQTEFQRSILHPSEFIRHLLVTSQTLWLEKGTVKELILSLNVSSNSSKRSSECVLNLIALTLTNCHSLNNVKMLLDDCPHLRQLQIRGGSRASEVGLIEFLNDGLISGIQTMELQFLFSSSLELQLTRFPQLMSLSIEMNHHVAFLSDEIPSLILECPRLKSLSLIGWPITDDTLDSILQSTRELTTLNLTLCKRLTDASVNILSKHCPCIKSLNLSRTSVTAQGIQTLSRTPIARHLIELKIQDPSVLSIISRTRFSNLKLLRL